LAGEEEEWLRLIGSARLTRASAAKQPHQKARARAEVGYTRGRPVALTGDGY
jgi:hypothetical protein